MVLELVESSLKYQATTAAWYDSHNYQFKNTKSHCSVVRELVKSIQKYQATSTAWYGNNNYQSKNTTSHRSVVRELVKSIQRYQTTATAWYDSHNYQFKNANSHLAVVRKPVNPIQKYQTPDKLAAPPARKPSVKPLYRPREGAEPVAPRQDFAAQTKKRRLTVDFARKKRQQPDGRKRGRGQQNRALVDFAQDKKISSRAQKRS